MARGIVVVHGVGEQKRGEALRDFVDPLVAYLESRGGRVALEPRLTPEQIPCQVTLKVLGPDARFAEEWRVVEAYWARAFEPPTLGQVYRWGKRLARQQVAATDRLFSNLTNEGPRDNCEEVRRRAAGRTSAQEPKAVPPLPPGTEESFRDQVFMLRLVVRGLEQAAPLLLSVVWAVLQLRWLSYFPPELVQWHWVASLASGVIKALSAVANALYPMFVLHLGDAKAFVDSPIAASAMRRSLEDCLISFFRDDDVDSITIVAHSLGASISYDALTEERRLDRLLREEPRLRRRPDGNGFRRINWVTVGAALNRTYYMSREGDSSHAVGRFSRPLAQSICTPEEAFFWLNLYARYDPVPAGPIEAELWHVMGVTCRQFKERVVINRDSLFGDHSSYFENAVLVWPRIVRAICDGEYPWRETELSEERNQELIRQLTIEAAFRYRRRDLRLAPFMVLGMFMLVLAIPLGLLLGGMARFLGRLYFVVSYALFYIPLCGLLWLARRLLLKR